MTIFSLTRFIIALLVFSIAGTIVIMIAQGYSLNPKSGILEKTGMIVVKSDPDGASVYLNDALQGTTQATLRNLTPGEYTLRVVKERYSSWEKVLKVEESLVTEVDLELFPSAPELKPVTYEGVGEFSVSHDRSLIVFTKPAGLSPGIYKIDLRSSLLDRVFTQNTVSTLIVADSPDILYSKAKLQLSPDNQEIIITITGDTAKYYKVDLDNQSNPSKLAQTEVEPLIKAWEDSAKVQSQEQFARLHLNYPDLLSIEQANFSNNEKALFYNIEGQLTVVVLDGSEYKTYQYHPLSQSVYWFPDGQHLAFVTLDSAQNTGVVSISEVDGANTTPLYSGPLSSDQIVFSQNGHFLFILAKYSPNADSLPNFYSISLTGE